MDEERGERTPLLGRGEKPPELKEMQTESIKETAVTAVAGAGFLSSFLSLIFESVVLHPSVLISGLLGLLLSPYAAFQQRKITQVEALKQTNEQMEEEVRMLTLENDRLQSQVNSIAGTVTNLKAMEETLAAVNALQGESASKLEQQLEESKEILKSMHQNKKAIVLQNLITVLFATDADQNMLLSNQEIDQLIQKMEGIHGVQLKEDLIRKTILDQGRSVGAVMEVARSVLNASEQDSMFSYIEETEQ